MANANTTQPTNDRNIAQVTKGGNKDETQAEELRRKEQDQRGNDTDLLEVQKKNDTRNNVPADEQIADREGKKESGSVKCYRSTVSQLSIQVDGQVAARFSPFLEKVDGEQTKVGYLETDDVEVQKRLESDENVEEVEVDDFKKATTGPKSFALPKATA